METIVRALRIANALQIKLAPAIINMRRAPLRSKVLFEFCRGDASGVQRSWALGESSFSDDGVPVSLLATQIYREIK